MRYPPPALAILAAAPLLASAAHAEPPAAPATPPPAAAAAHADAHRVSLALLGGYGVNDSSSGGGDALDIYGPGVGARAGYTFSPHVYVGASFVYHVGFSKDLGAGQSGSGRVAPLGLEAGYDLALGSFTVRPYLGAGVAFYRSSLDGVPYPERGSGSKIAFWPGVTATYDLGERAFVGLDARYTVLLVGGDTTIVAAGQGSADALGIFATLGVRV